MTQSADPAASLSIDRGAMPEARPAATVVVARDARGPDGRPDRSGGVELLVLRRSPASRFAPRFVVFPGGLIEPGDAALALEWFGTREEQARACAIRELAEETGLVMTDAGLREAPGRRPGDPGLAPPARQLIPEISRWVAPEFLPVRFDARFFAVAAGRDVDARADGVEADLAWWGRPKQIVEDSDSGDTLLMWPTRKMLEATSRCRRAEDVLALRVEQVPPPVPPVV